MHQNMLVLESALGLQQAPDQTHPKFQGNLMICFMRLAGGINFDSLKRDFSQIHSSTNEGIGI